MTPTDEKKAAVTSGGKSKTNNSSYRAAAAAAIQQAVAQCVGGGLSIIPIDHHTKRPAMALLPRGADGKATWSRFGESPADIDMLMSWLNAKPLAIAVVCGRVSDGLLVMDFDVQRFYELWKSNVGELADGLPVQQTGGGGYQVFLRCANPGGNIKLAWAADDAEESGRTIAIETRGDGGYVVVPPSLHPSGGRYTMISGTLADVPVIDQDRADALVAAARKLDEAPQTKSQREQLEAQARAQHRNVGSNYNKRSSVIEAFNRAHTIEEMLENHGYAKARGGRYIRPGGHSASVSVHDGRSCHWSTNDPLNDGKLRDGMGVHDAFGIFTQLDHSGDVRAAVKAAAEKLGIESPAGNGGQEVPISVGIDAEPLRLSFEKEFSDVNGGAKGRATVRQDNTLLHADRVDLTSAISRTRFANAIARKLIRGGTEDFTEQQEIVVAEVEDALLIQLEKMQDAKPVHANVSGEPDHQALLDEMPQTARAGAEEMLKDPTLMTRILDGIRTIGIAG